MALAGQTVFQGLAVAVRFQVAEGQFDLHTSDVKRPDLTCIQLRPPQPQASSVAFRGFASACSLLAGLRSEAAKRARKAAGRTGLCSNG